MKKMLKIMAIVALMCSGVSAMAMTEEAQGEQAVRLSLKKSLATMNDEAKLKNMFASSLKETMDKEDAKYVLEMGIAAAERYLVLQADKPAAGPKEAALREQDLQETLSTLNILKSRLKQLQ
jgi:hypothetical protein